MLFVVCVCVKYSQLTVIISLLAVGGVTTDLSPVVVVLLLLLLVSLNEHADKPGAVIGNNDIKLLFAVFVTVPATVEVVDIVFNLLEGGCHLFESVNFGLPRFLCLMSIQVSHFPSAEHRLQGRDTIISHTLDTV